MPISLITANSQGGAPAFSAYLSGTQTISSGVWTKAQFATKEWDTANCFDSTTNYRFTPNVAGYYQINSQADIYASGSSITNSVISIYKNGTESKRGTLGSITGTEYQSVVSAVIYLNGSTDYIELYVNATSGGTITLNGSAGKYGYFQAYFVRSA